MKELTKSYIQRISNILLINSGFLDNPGLFTGEMGLVLFFFRYARYSKNELIIEHTSRKHSSHYVYFVNTRQKIDIL